MKIQYCSDLHLEFPENKEFMASNPIQKSGDILILAGDIFPLSQLRLHEDFLDQISNLFDVVYWIPGNHEFYYDTIDEFTKPVNRKIRDNVFLCHNHVESFLDVEIAFSTLWTPISPSKELLIQERMSDYYLIERKGKQLRVTDTNELFDVNKIFLQNFIENKDVSKKSIIVTHHVPTWQHYPAKYKNSPINEAFAANLDTMIEHSEVNYWIYGHSHVNVKKFNIGNTKLMSNQLGYVRYAEHKSYRKNCII